MKIKAAFLGFGARGQCYANYIFANESAFEVVAVAEPKKHLQKLAVEKYKCPANAVFDNWKAFIESKVEADLVFVVTQDNDHVEPAIEAIKAGYKYLMVEKPIDKDINKCKLLAEIADDYQATVQVCHSLRYTNFYRRVKSLLDSGIIGDIRSIDHIEALGTFHFAHSYVRGDWRRDDSSPMILAKCCHDTDLLLWLTGQHCKSISSYGSLDFFKEENAPAGAPVRCIEGCPHNEVCPYSAMKYFGEYKDHLFREYAVEKEGFSSTDEAMRNGRYGRCVFHSDNNVVDHQTVNILFENNATATLTMCGFSNAGRETHIMGTMGEIRACMKTDTIEVYNFRNGDKEVYHIGHPMTLHGGADTNMVADAIAVIKGEKAPMTSIKESVESHIMSIAAEESRICLKTIDLNAVANR